MAVFGLRARRWETYVPSGGEIGITVGITAGAVFVFGVLIRRNGHFQTEYGAPAEGRGALRDKDYAILRGLRVTTSP